MHLSPTAVRFGLVVAALAASSWFSGTANLIERRVNAQESGPVNLGFEDGALDGAPLGWAVTAAADAAQVVDTEGPSEFGTYAEQDITVEPNEGTLMLRLGSPKMVSQSQPRGENVVTQTFSSVRDELNFSFRVLSWEHRGTDSFSFNLVDPSSPGSFAVADVETGQPVVVLMPDGSTRTCAQTPCQLNIDVGQSGQFLDSVWTEVTVSGLPDDGRELVLTYSVLAGQSESHGTWAYFDRPTNAPPVARFSFQPGSALESDFVQFIDQSYDPDDGDSIVSWLWTFGGPNVPEHTSDQQNPIFSFPDDGTFDVSLTVTDTHGASATISSGEQASDGTLVPAAAIGNAGMLVSVLDLEVPAGQPAQLVARFLDPGWLDTHEATWTVEGNAFDAAVLEENQPALSSGLISGTFLTGSPGVLSGTLQVTDDGGETATAPFTITVLGEDFDRREANDTVATAPQLRSGSVYVSDLSAPSDVDLFEAVGPSGAPLPSGSELLVTLSDVPADFDLVVLAQSPSDVAAAPFLSSPFLSSPFLSSPFLSSPFLSSPFLSSPFLSSPFLSSPFLSSPFLSSPFLSSPFLSSPFLSSPFLSSSLTFDQFPLSQIGFAAPGGDSIYGSDVSLVELGLGALVDEDLQVVGHSANRGLADEKVLVRSDLPGTRLYVAVVGNNGAYASAPYSLGIETSRPLDLQAFLGQNCSGSPVVTTGATSQLTTLYDHPGSDLTLIVTQRERMMALYGLDDDGWNAMLADLIALADHPSIAADIVSVPSSLFDAWDSDPCSIEAANEVAAGVRDRIEPLLDGDANKQYLVFAGNDDIIPHRRVPDETVIGNESLYGTDAFLMPGSPLWSSISHGMSLTDDYYADRDPQPWQGRELYVPDWNLGRLVETPEEIRAAAQAFVSSNGRLTLDTALVTGYDFFSDGSSQTAGALSALSPETLINETWTADDLRCRFLAASGGDGCAAHGVNAVNAHFTHYAALSAQGFTTQNFGDFITSAEVAAAGGGVPSLAGTLAFTIGCHAGFSVPDRAAIPPEAGLSIDPRLDFAQAMARQRAVFVANTGFGLGDSEGVAGNEELMIIFAQELAKGGPAGRALAAAKREFLLRQAALSVYVEKSSITTTMWGLPQYVADVPLTATSTSTEAAFGASAVPASAAITLDDGGTVTVATPVLSEVSTADGAYVAADGDYQATAGRAIQPRVLLDLPEDATNGPVHGIVVRGGTYEDTEPFDPVISRPQQEWDVNAEEPQVCLDAYWPSVFALVNSLSSPQGLLQKAVIVPGQFRCTSADASTVTGQQRIYNTLALSTRRSTSTDFEPPALGPDGLRIVENGSGELRVTVDATDDSGIAEVIAYVLHGGELVVAESGPLTGSGPFSVDIPVQQSEDERLVVQIVDGAGNVSTLTGKGANLHIVRVDAGPDQSVDPSEPVDFTGTVLNFDDLLGGATDISYVWDFGDGDFGGGTLAIDGVPDALVSIDGAGNATFIVQHTFAAPPSDALVATLTVTDGLGGVGIDEAAVTMCPDPNLCDADGDGFLDKPSTSHARVNTNRDEDNCPSAYNPDQLNSEGWIDNGPTFPGDDGTVPASDVDGDACDADSDNDGLPNMFDTNPLAPVGPCAAFAGAEDGHGKPSGGDNSNDDDGDGYPAPPMAGDAGDDGPSWDTDNDGVLDGYECAHGSNPRDRTNRPVPLADDVADTDGDGLRNGWERGGWGTDPFTIDSDGDGRGDCLEAADVDGNGMANSSGDFFAVAQVVFKLYGKNLDFDLDKNGIVNSTGDLTEFARLVFTTGACK